MVAHERFGLIPIHSSLDTNKNQRPSQQASNPRASFWAKNPILCSLNPKLPFTLLPPHSSSFVKPFAVEFCKWITPPKKLYLPHPQQLPRPHTQSAAPPMLH